MRLLLGLMVLATALRLFRLDAQSLWMDEVASLTNAQVFATRGFTALAHVDRIAPLHTLVIWAATRLGGQGEIAARFPSVFFEVLSVPALYLAARRVLGSRRVGLISAALLTVSPYALYYAQEARMYALLLLCVCVYVAVAWPVVERALRPGELLLLTVITAIGLYTHHYMGLLACAFGLFLALKGGLVQRRAWVWALSQLGALALFSYWLVISSDQLGAQSALPKPAFLLWAPYTYFTFVFGLSFGPSVRELQLAGAAAALAHHQLAVGLGILAVAILGVAGVRRAMRPELRTSGLWLATWLVVPVALALVATLVTKVQFNVRYGIVSFPAALILLALGLDHLRWPRAVGAPGPLHLGGGAAKLAAAIVLIALTADSLWNFYFDAAYAKEDVRALAGAMRRPPQDALIVADNSRVAPILQHYGAPLPRDAVEVDNLLWGRTPAVALQALQRLTPPRDVWLITYRPWETDPDGRVATWLEAHGSVTSARAWPGVSLRTYHLSARLPPWAVAPSGPTFPPRGGSRAPDSPLALGSTTIRGPPCWGRRSDCEARQYAR